MRKSCARLGLLILSMSTFVPANAGTTLPAGLYKQHASGVARGIGDYVSNAATGLNAPYRWYIEVPPSTSNLTVQLFDSDFGRNTAGGESGTSGSPANRDRAIGGGTYSSAVQYRLIRPDNTTAATLTRDNTNGIDNDWEQLASIANPANGHWVVEVDSSSAITAGDDINGYGIRAHDGTAGSGGTELNVYSESYITAGPHQIANNFRQLFRQYFYVTSGCDCYIRDFDTDDDTADVISTVDVQSRNGSFNPGAVTMTSIDNVWATTTFTGFADDGPPVAGRTSDGYGPWLLDLTVDGQLTTGSNYIVFYAPSFASPNAPFTGGNASFAPNSQPEENSFRIYLPRDGSTVDTILAPQLPYVRQYIYDVVSGPNPPRNGQQTFMRLRVDVVNPTAHSITFSASNLVTVNVPATRVQYQNPSAVLSQGSIVSQPAQGGNGNITWNPGVLAAGETATLEYRVRVAPTGNNQTTTVTGTPASNGTTARFVDATGNTTQARATFTFGPICQLSVISTAANGTGGSTLSVDLLDFQANLQADGNVKLTWTTQDEIENAGFEVISAQRSGQVGVDGDVLTSSPIPSLGQEGGTYEWSDSQPLGLNQERGYYLVDIDFAGTRTYHGPVYINNFAASLDTKLSGWQSFD